MTFDKECFTFLPAPLTVEFEIRARPFFWRLARKIMRFTHRTINCGNNFAITGAKFCFLKWRTEDIPYAMTSLNSYWAHTSKDDRVSKTQSSIYCYLQNGKKMKQMHTFSLPTSRVTTSSRAKKEIPPQSLRFSPFSYTRTTHIMTQFFQDRRTRKSHECVST